jgi:hypothetical protein
MIIDDEAAVQSAAFSVRCGRAALGVMGIYRLRLLE